MSILRNNRPDGAYRIPLGGGESERTAKEAVRKRPESARNSRTKKAAAIREGDISVKTLIYRWRLWWICRKLKIKPLKWQKAYALGTLDRFCGHIGGRATGKTMAVILYGLVRKVKTRELVEMLALRDPDTTRPDGSIYYRRREWFVREYAKMAQKVGLGG